MVRSFIAGVVCSMLLALQGCSSAASHVAPPPRTTPVETFAPPQNDGELVAFDAIGSKEGKAGEAKQSGLRAMVSSDKDMNKGIVEKSEKAPAHSLDIEKASSRSSGERSE